MKKEFKNCNFVGSIIIIVFMLISVLAGVAWLSIDLNLALLASIGVAIVVLVAQGCKWSLIEKAVESAGKISVMPSIVILCVGAVVASWIASGTIPTIIYWGLKLINPSFFVVSAFILCAVISIVTGSSLSSVGTVGIALIVMSNVLDINVALTSGAIISGAYLGDKMSPLSDTTNLAPAVAEADLFDHIKSMMYSAVPVVVICLVLYTVLGFGASGDTILNEDLQAVLTTIETTYNMSFLTFLPVLVMLVLAIKKVPALPSMFISVIVASLIAIFMQGVGVNDMFSIIYGGYSPATGNDIIDSLLNRGGLDSMFWTVMVGILAVVFGEILQQAGVFYALILKLTKATSTVGGLTATVVVSCIAVNILTGEQYMSILLPGKMWQDKYKEKGLLPQVLSRALESGGTVTAPLVPWNLGGVNCTRLLGVSTYAYLPFCFLGFLFPIIEIIYGFTGKFMWKTGDIASKKTYAPVVTTEA